MGWAQGVNDQGREVGYGVAATCDLEGCEAEIDRGLAYSCGGLDAPTFGGDKGCGGYFCTAHLVIGNSAQVCVPCGEKELCEHGQYDDCPDCELVGLPGREVSREHHQDQ